MDKSAIDDFIDELNYEIYELYLRDDVPPVKLAIKSWLTDDIQTPNQNFTETHLIFQFSETVFSKAQIGFQTVQTMAYDLIPRLFESLQSSNENQVEKFVSLKALHALVISGDKAIFANLLANGILAQALNFLQASRDQYMETYSVLILWEIFQNEDNVLDDVTKDGVVQQLIKAGLWQLANPEEDVSLRQNVIWVIGKLFQTTFQPQSTITNKLQEFMKFLIEQSFIAERVWDQNFERALRITLSAFNETGQFQFLDNLLCQGMQKMVGKCSANYVTNLSFCFTFYFIDYPKWPGDDEGTGNLDDISANQLATLRKMMTHLATSLNEMDPARMTELFQALNTLFYSFSECIEARDLVWECGCFPFYVTFFSHGDQHNDISWQYIGMMNCVVQDATLEGLRCLFAAGLAEALQDYEKGFKNGTIDPYLKADFDEMIQKLLRKLNEYQEFDLVQALLWPGSKG